MRFSVSEVEPDDSGSESFGSETVGIVDEQAGGIIAYCHRDNANRIASSMETAQR